MSRLSLLAAGVLTLAAPAAAITYPATPRGDQTDVFFGTTVADPYRWLENDVRTDPKVADWVAAQNRATDAFVATLPRRTAIAARLKQLYDYEKFGVPRRRGGRVFYLRNSGLQNQFVLYVQDDSAVPRVLLDPNGWSNDGATALGEWEPSPDGTRVAYGVQDGGTDWRTVRVVDTATGAVLPDRLDWVKFSELAWSRDGRGFFYSRFAAPADGDKFQSANLDQKLYYHILGTPQSADRLVYATPERPKLTHSATVTDDGRWLVINSAESDPEELAVLDLKTPGAKPRIVFPLADRNWSVVGSRGTTLYLTADDGAPRKRIVAVDLALTVPATTTVVPESAATIRTAALVGDRFVVTTMEDAKSVVRRYALDGTPQGVVALPGIGTATGFESDEGRSDTFYAFSSFNVPTTIYRYDAKTNASTVFRQPKTPFDAAQYVVAQVFYTSKDGTRVPMFVAHKRGLDLTKGVPTLLYGYGGFNVAQLPGFSVGRLAWMEMGGVFAMANLRGGGEYGKAWHDAGKTANKQNVFDDFIAAAQALIAAGTTTPAKLAIQGGSNGGLLVGAVVNQRPDLFAAALPQVGVMDMLRFDRFTAGRFWVSDYGDPATEADFRALYAYSPYHNIRGGKPYPAILAATADTDDRVVPGHSFKYTAALQSVPGLGDKPRLIRIETRAGHGSGKPLDKTITEIAADWAFIGHFTGMDGTAAAGTAGAR